MEIFLHRIWMKERLSSNWSVLKILNSDWLSPEWKTCFAHPTLPQHYNLVTLDLWLWLWCLADLSWTGGSVVIMLGVIIQQCIGYLGLLTNQLCHLKVLHHLYHICTMRSQKFKMIKLSILPTNILSRDMFKICQDITSSIVSQPNVRHQFISQWSKVPPVDCNHHI